MKAAVQSIAIPQGFTPGAQGDPTELRCIICNSPYPLNTPRVIKELRSPRKGDRAAKLCWVCARLQYTVRNEKHDVDLHVSIPAAARYDA